MYYLWGKTPSNCLEYFCKNVRTNAKSYCKHPLKNVKDCIKKSLTPEFFFLNIDSFFFNSVSFTVVKARRLFLF